MPQEEITPSNFKQFIESAKIPNAPINNGPLVYDLTKQGSASGIDPECYHKDGICVRSER